MQRTGLYIEDAGSYYRRRYKKERITAGKKRILLILAAMAAVCGVLVQGTISEGGILPSFNGGAVDGAPMFSQDLMSSNDMSGNGTVSSGDAGVSQGDAEVTDDTAKNPDISEEGFFQNTDPMADCRQMAAENASGPKEAAEIWKKRPENLLIVIDPGHGGEDSGCFRSGVEEKQVNLEIAKAVEAGLQKMGYQVLLTRDSDTALSLEERVQSAQTAGADLFVSIHQNSYEENNVKGMEVWYNSQNAGEDSKRLAQLIQLCTVQNTDAEDRGILEEEELYVIRENTMPSCLVETGFLSNTSERGKLTDPEYQDRIAKGIVSGIDLFFHPKTMYLTFDDGPSSENTNAVLDILKEHGIKATFFVVGENVRKHPEVARRIVEEGHTIGIHCNNHDYDKLYESTDSYLADFDEAYQAVYETTGVEAKLFRFPGGSINAYNEDVYEEIIEKMTDKGFVYYDWNASLEDAVKKADQEALIENARSSTLGRRRIVMLGHDIVYQTTQCLDALIESFPDYEFLPLTEEVEPVQF